MTTSSPASFRLMHTGESIGTSRLESGDPAAHSVSGVFVNVGGAKALAGWLKSVGGTEDDGVVYITMNEDFELQDGDGETLSFGAGTLISVPAQEETFVEFTGISAADYDAHFAGHVAAMAADADKH